MYQIVLKMTGTVQQDSNSAAYLLSEATRLEDVCRIPEGDHLVKLLLDRGMDPNEVNKELLQTPLHVAAECGFSSILQVLLSDTRIDVNARNGSEQTALHIAVKNCTEDPKRFRHCISLLLEASADVNAVDWLGNTALHYATDEEAAVILLNHGAFLGARNLSGEMPISHFNPETFEAFLDSCINKQDNDTLLVRFEFLVPLKQTQTSVSLDEFIGMDLGLGLASNVPEMDPVLAISVIPGLCHLLAHPVIAIFICAKWQLLRKFYFASLLFYSIFVIVITSVIIEQTREGFFCQFSPFRCAWRITGKVLLAVLCLCELLKLIFLLTITPVCFFKQFINYIKLLFLVFSFIVFFIGGCNAAGALSLIIGWLLLFILIGEHPSISVHSYLLSKICLISIQFVAWSMFLILAFALPIFIFFELKTNNPEKITYTNSFSNPFQSVGKVLGGIKAKFMPFESFVVVSSVIFLLFCLLLLVLLTNASLAVAHARNVLKNSEFIQLKRTVETTSDLERILLGNPRHIQLWTKLLALNHNPTKERIFNFVVKLWQSCSCLCGLKVFAKSIMLYPTRSIIVPCGGKSNVVCDFSINPDVVERAVNIVNGCKLSRSRAKQLRDIERTLEKSEEIQSKILELLQQ